MRGLLELCDAANYVQRIWRGHTDRRQFAVLVLYFRHDLATKIQKAYRASVVRDIAKVMAKLRNRSAFRIQHSYTRYKARCKWYEIRRIMAERAEEDRRIAKETLIRKKREKFLEKCFAMGDERASKNIQKHFRAHVSRLSTNRKLMAPEEPGPAAYPRL